MRARLLLAVVALLALPACLDPIVGTQCARGYSPCGSKCVPAGSCALRDAGQAADGEEPSDAEIANSGDDGGTPAVEVDGASVADDTDVDSGLGGDDALTVDDAITVDGTVAVDDAITEDGGRNDSSLLCVGCVDAVDTDASASDETGALLGADAGDSSGDETGVLLASDGGADDAGGESATMADASEATGDVALPDTGPLQCPGQLAACDDQCVNLFTDPENCGGCSTMCSSGVCINGGCLICSSIETVCGQQCTNTASDPDNCGSCGVPCASGLCSNSHCEDWGTGRVIVIGHDYLKNRTAMNRILGNAVFLWPINPVRLLTYKLAANPRAITGADGAIAQVALAQGRQVQRTDLVDGDVATQLAAADVFLIYGQELASDTTLNQLGQDWASAMSAFVNRGGTVIVLDGLYPGNAGTVQIISQAGLFAIQQKASVTNAVCTVVARGDALANGLLKNYLCEPNSVSFKTTEAPSAFTSVVESGGVYVVVHKLF